MIRTIKRLGQIILDIFVVLVIISSIFITIITLTSNKDGVPNIMGYSPFSIQSNSMEPTFSKGDLIIDEKVDVKSLKVGDIISYFDTVNGQNIIKTHRITNITEEKGFYLFNTKGDNNDVEDQTVVFDVDVVGKYANVKALYLGYVMDFLKSKWGFLCCIVIPLTLIFISQVIEFIKRFIEYKTEGTKK